MVAVRQAARATRMASLTLAGRLPLASAAATVATEGTVAVAVEMAVVLALAVVLGSLAVAAALRLADLALAWVARRREARLRGLLAQRVRVLQEQRLSAQEAQVRAAVRRLAERKD